MDVSSLRRRVPERHYTYTPIAAVHVVYTHQQQYRYCCSSSGQYNTIITSVLVLPLVLVRAAYRACRKNARQHPKGLSLIQLPDTARRAGTDVSCVSVPPEPEARPAPSPGSCFAAFFTTRTAYEYTLLVVYRQACLECVFRIRLRDNDV